MDANLDTFDLISQVFITGINNELEKSGINVRVLFGRDKRESIASKIIESDYTSFVCWTCHDSLKEIFYWSGGFGRHHTDCLVGALRRLRDGEAVLHPMTIQFFAKLEKTDWDLLLEIVKKHQHKLNRVNAWLNV